MKGKMFKMVELLPIGEASEKKPKIPPFPAGAAAKNLADRLDVIRDEINDFVSSTNKSEKNGAVTARQADNLIKKAVILLRGIR